MFVTKFIYDLTGRPEPSDDELDGEIDRLLFVKSAETPNYLAQLSREDRDQLRMDSEVISLWIKRRFGPALILLLLSEDNIQHAKSELAKMERYKTFIDKFFRPNFVHRHAMQKAKEMCFDDSDSLKLPQVVTKLKMVLTFLSKHLEQNSPGNMTLLGTDAYTPADIILYSYLKRIVVGRYKDLGLKSHVRLCDPLIQFMNRYATKNTYVINVTSEDPLANAGEESSLISDLTPPALVALGFILLFLWRKG